ncbi:MAG: hypothetical protein AAFR20_08230 [Pseudomonadota bacterium]
MIRSHRRAHLLIWLVVGATVGVLAMLLWLGQPTSVTAPLPDNFPAPLSQLSASSDGRG